MPIYEYVCKDCSKKFEMVRSISQADAAVACSSCNSMHTQRILSTCFSKGGDGISESSASSGGCHSCSGGSCSHCGH